MQLLRPTARPTARQSQARNAKNVEMVVGVYSKFLEIEELNMQLKVLNIKILGLEIQANRNGNAEEPLSVHCL